MCSFDIRGLFEIAVGKIQQIPSRGFLTIMILMMSITIMIIVIVILVILMMIVTIIINITIILMMMMMMTKLIVTIMLSYDEGRLRSGTGRCSGVLGLPFDCFELGAHEG